MSKIPIIIVAGATASGKTSLSIALAKALGGEIISADSMQIYKEMDIGTAKPTVEEREGIPHHILDFLEPSESFSVAEFCEMAHKTAADIHKRGKKIIVVGGTGLYIDSFAKDIDFDEEESLPDLRKELQQRAEAEGAESLLAELAKFDRVSAERLHPNNLKRIIRAIEFYKLHGEPISVHQERTKQKPSRYEPIYMMIDHQREVLRDRISKRVDLMIEQGLPEEAERLFKKRDTLSKTARSAIAYKELFGYFEGEMTLKEAADELKLRTAQYAKRQLTWFRKNPDMHLLSPDNAVAEALGIIAKNKV